MCLYPKLIPNPKYKTNKKNGGDIPPVKDERVKWVPIGCTKCIECMKQRSRQWQARLLEDIKSNRNGKFICLTYSNENYSQLSKEVKKNIDVEGYELDNQIATLSMRRFLERWRKKYKKSLRHWMVTELGHTNTEHLHMHGIIWTNEPLDTVENIWQYGHVWKGKIENSRGHITYKNYVNEATISYMVKYMTKVDFQHKEYKQIILCSPGIGKNYTNTIDAKANKFKGKETNETYRTRTGHKIGLPLYWKNKIYSESEREELWIQKLDLQIRWVCGNKVDISKSDTEYYKLLEWYRRRNTQLGYGNDETNWEREQYERQRRILKQKARSYETQINA